MIIPVHSDKTINSNLDKTAHSNPSTNAKQEEGKPLSTEAQTNQNIDSMPDVDTARQLYEMENSRPETLRSTLETPEQAKSMLEQIVQQMTDLPEKAFQSQTNVTTGQISNLLGMAAT